MAEMKIPIPEEVQDDIRALFTQLAKDAIQDARRQERKAYDYMTLQETCEYLNISPGTLIKWRGMGLKVAEIEGKKFINYYTLRDFIESHEI